MITGLGTDIADIARIKKTLERDGAERKFCKRFFTEAENEYFASKNYSAQTVAACFAAKEAFSKALGTGIRDFALKDIEVLHDKLGKPYFKLYNSLEKIGIENNVLLTLSHSREYAVAVAVIEKL